MTPPNDLDAIEALANAATEGPWSTRALGRLLRFGRKNDGPWDEADEDEPEDGATLPHDDDAAFIAASRTFVPAAIAELRELRAENARIAKHIELAAEQYTNDRRMVRDRFDAALEESQAECALLRKVVQAAEYHSQEGGCPTCGNAGVPCPPHCPLAVYRAALGAKGAVCT